MLILVLHGKKYAWMQRLSILTFKVIDNKLTTVLCTIHLHLNFGIKIKLLISSIYLELIWLVNKQKIIFWTLYNAMI